MTNSDSLKVLLRVAAEIFNRSYRVRKYFDQIGPGETGEHKQITNVLEKGFSNVEEVVREKIGIFVLEESDKTLAINGLYDELGRFSRWFLKLHSLLSYLPRQPVTPETVYSLRSPFGNLYSELIKPTIILGNVVNAYEYDFFEVLESEIPDLREIVLDDSENIVLQLAICDRESPPAWAILAHEMGHAIDDAKNISSNVTSEFVTDVDSYSFDRVQRWCCELCADLIAAEVLGAAPILSILSLEYCVFPLFPDFDVYDLSQSHPPTRWRIEAVSDWIRDRHGWDLLDKERKFLEIVWQFSFERAHPNVEDRVELLAVEQEAHNILLRGLVDKLKPRIIDLQLPSIELSKDSIDRCQNRLAKNSPIGAQGIKRADLRQKIENYRMQVGCLPNDGNTVGERAKQFRVLKSEFLEKPLNAATIFYSGHLEREAVLSLDETSIDHLTTESGVKGLCQKLSRIDALCSSSIRGSSVHNRLLDLLET